MLSPRMAASIGVEAAGLAAELNRGGWRIAGTPERSSHPRSVAVTL